MNFSMRPTPLLITGACAGAICLAGCQTQKKEPTRPNILLCIADDAGFPFMSAYGTPFVNTPAFDRVAREGIRFDNAYTCNAKSAPSRAAIITGRNSWQLEDACNHWPYFPAKFKSYPETMEEHGYYVGTTGKGWSPGVAKDSLGNTRELTGTKWSQIKLKAPTKGISNIDYAANFKAFLENRPEGKPFCFWYGALEPHRGFEYGSGAKAGKNTSQIDSVPAYWPDNETVRNDMLDYAVEIEHFDNHLGQMLQILEEKGELDNTIVIVTSDHGMPFPRGKGQAYEASNHIPFAMMWKNGLTNPGRVETDYISVIDIAPTLLEAAGIDEAETGMQPITGRSMIDIIKDKKNGTDRNWVLIGKERHDVGRPDDQGYPIRGIIRGDYLYLKNYETERWPTGNPETGYMNVDGSPTKTEVLKARRDKKTEYLWELSFGKRQAEELYNIKEDKDCMRNLISNKELQDIRRSLEKELTDKLKEQKDPRMFGKGDVFDKYVNASRQRLVWNRMKAGETVPAPWINESDYEPNASGLEVTWEE